MIWFWGLFLAVVFAVGIVRGRGPVRRRRVLTTRHGRRAGPMAAAGRLRPWKGRESVYTQGSGPVGPMVRIATYSLDWQANLAATALGNEGIPCIVQEPGAYGSMLGVNLMIPESSLHRWEEIQRIIRSIE